MHNTTAPETFLQDDRKIGRREEAQILGFARGPRRVTVRLFRTQAPVRSPGPRYPWAGTHGTRLASVTQRPKNSDPSDLLIFL
jgi:hypothetical protein